MKKFLTIFLMVGALSQFDSSAMDKNIGQTLMGRQSSAQQGDMSQMNFKDEHIEKRPYIKGDWTEDFDAALICVIRNDLKYCKDGPRVRWTDVALHFPEKPLQKLKDHFWHHIYPRNEELQQILKRNNKKVPLSSVLNREKDTPIPAKIPANFCDELLKILGFL